MNKIWKKKSNEEIKNTVFEALNNNVNYAQKGIIGVPATYLDEKVFNQNAAFLKDAPYMSALVANPNHIGCHTLGESEPFFAGTHDIERELLDICAVDILKGEAGQYDGYVASGGTEANIQAIWIYRNLFMKKYQAKQKDILILCSSDSHYSMDKASNVLGIDILKYQVTEDDRSLDQAAIKQTIQEAQAKGKKYFIVIANMMTTMFGSVDDVDVLVDCLESESCTFKLHVDGAYGGFYFPFSQEESPLTFKNPAITSFTLDAHKMAQSPYGTGIFLIRKDYIEYANTKEASYVAGEDFTLIGSRSGANAIAVWMILVKNGPFGWYEKVFILQKRAAWICEKLKNKGIEHYRNPYSNIVTIRSKYVSEALAQKYGIVPDNHDNPNWYKIVIMEHVTLDRLMEFAEDIYLSMED